MLGKVLTRQEQGVEERDQAVGKRRQVKVQLSFARCCLAEEEEE